MNHLFRISSLLLLVLFATNGLLAREVKKLNRSWRFTYGWEVRSNISTEVNLPHTWNQDALAGKQNYYRGLGNYEKDIVIDQKLKGKRIYLKFYGVNTVANVFINKKHTVEHRGGYTAFVVEITDFVNYGKKNTIMVRVNNAPTLDIMPLLGDFNMYGGIYRDVELIVTEPSHISLTDYASTGVYLLQKEVSDKRAEVEATLITNSVGDGERMVRLELLDGEKVVLTKESVVSAGQGQNIKIPFEIKNPHLWNGTEDPFMYDVKITLWSDGKELDCVEEKLGVRYFRVDPNLGFFLNGEHLQLKGVCRHQDRAEVGNALTKVHHDEDMEIMAEMGVNSIRLAHYPQAKYFYNLCDESGLIIWAEIPFIGPGGYRDKGFVNQTSFKENGKQQLVELIRQNFNHPSICFWGMFNELKQYGDDPCDYVIELNKLAKQEDPSRVTTSASNQRGRLNELTETVAWNQYHGWYGGEPSGIGKWADATHKKYPNTPIGISEYGAGGSILHQQDSLFKPVANSYWHPENWQTYFHEEHWKAIDARPFLWGTFVWNMFDFGAAHRTEGEIAGKNDKGLVTFDRNVRKDAFYFYKANWNKKEPFVYIAEHRNHVRSQAEQQIKVYSNQSEVELVVNGKSYGKRKGEFGIFIWADVVLTDGENTLEANSKKATSHKITLLYN